MDHKWRRLDHHADKLFRCSKLLCTVNRLQLLNFLNMTDLILSPIYYPRRSSSVEHLTLRGNVRYQIRRWSTPAAVTLQRPTLVLAPGWMDVGASFQFMMDHMTNDRHVIALDWRGFGGSSVPAPIDSYCFNDYLGDLDALVDQVAPDAPIDLLGHSMGGNIVMSYAGLRPARIRRLVNLEGFGLPDTSAHDAPVRLVQWLDELKVPQRFRSYASVEDVVARLVKNSPHLKPECGAWLARNWATLESDGRWWVLGDPAHRRVNPVLYRREEALACWRAITAPLLWVEGANTDVGDRYPRSEFNSRLAIVAEVKRVVINDCGHMLHLDQPEALARTIEEFLGS